MPASTFQLDFTGGILQRGFWLYVWEVVRTKGENFYYVGRTGDNSSIKAQSPFVRMGQHLGFAKNSNMLRRHLQDHGEEPEHCKFRLVAHGPIIDETQDAETHWQRRDIMAACEKALAEAMCAAGYKVMNTVKSRAHLDRERFEEIRNAFAAEFPGLSQVK